MEKKKQQILYLIKKKLIFSNTKEIDRKKQFYYSFEITEVMPSSIQLLNYPQLVFIFFASLSENETFVVLKILKFLR